MWKWGSTSRARQLDLPCEKQKKILGAQADIWTSDLSTSRRTPQPTQASAYLCLCPLIKCGLLAWREDDWIDQLCLAKRAKKREAYLHQKAGMSNTLPLTHHAMNGEANCLYTSAPSTWTCLCRGGGCIKEWGGDKIPAAGECVVSEYAHPPPLDCLAEIGTRQVRVGTFESFLGRSHLWTVQVYSVVFQWQVPKWAFRAFKPRSLRGWDL